MLKNIETLNAKLLVGGSVIISPLGSQPVAAQWQSDITSGSIAPFGSTYSFQGVTPPYTPGQTLAFGLVDTYISSYDDRMPAYWNVEWSHPPYCTSQTAPYGPIPNPFSGTFDFEPSSPTNQFGPTLNLFCFTNSPLNPGFVPTNVTPQFALDDNLPPSIRVATILPVQAAPSITNLHVFGTDLSNPANSSATSVAGDGSSVIFPYPRQSDGTALPAGAYLTTITTDPSGSPQTTNAMEAFYVGHDDTSFTSAYGVAIASPKTITTIQGPLQNDPNGGPASCSSTQTTDGGTPLPLVTLLTQNALAIGSMSNTIPVGVSPTVVIPFHDNPVTKTLGTGICRKTVIQYSGAQSALVVNTGSNSVSIVQVGENPFPTGTVSVGSQPVAAVINPSETKAYIANYSDGTLSEVDLSALTVTRTMSIMPHPTSLAFDSNGNLWAAGQGSVVDVNVSSWFISSTSSIDGTVNGMSYDTSTGLLVQMLLQNGSVAVPSDGTTGSNAISYSSSNNVSYSTQNAYSVATGTNSIVPVTSAASDNAIYSQSSVTSYLAFPAQTAFTPPIYTTSSGDLTATVSGNSFTVSVIGTNQVLINGVLPHPARGVALSSNILYFTMPDSNSLVSLPLNIP